MTTDEALARVEKRVQWHRQEGECDLRSIIYYIQSLRKDLAEGKEPAPDDE